MTHDPHQTTPAGKPRARSLGIPLLGTPGTWNAITDVPGLEVGYTTLIEGEGVRTGVTAIHPRGKDGAGDPLAAGFFSLNGNGEMTGVSWIEESGTTAGPIAITNTHAIGPAHAGIVRWTVKHHPQVAEAWLLPVAAETWDGYLNDINGGHVTEEHAVAALEAAASGPIEEGSVGGGTGMCCYEFKGGTGTASRIVEYGGTTYTVGVLVQANFGHRERAGDRRHADGRDARRRQPDGRVGRRPARRRLGDRDRRHRRAAPARAVQGAGAAGDLRAGADGDDRLALLRRPLPGRLDRRTRARSRAAARRCSGGGRASSTGSSSCPGGSSIRSTPRSPTRPRRRC